MTRFLLFLFGSGEKTAWQLILRHSEVLQLVEQLTPEEQARLIVEIRERSQGFGIWKERADLADPGTVRCTHP